MATPPPKHRFELNCFKTKDGFDCADLSFKAIKITSPQGLDYRQIRELLQGIDAIWYAEGDQIFLVGSEREIVSRFNETDYKILSARSVTYNEILTQRQTILRFMVYRAIDRMMRQHGFLPSIGGQHRTYYPYSDGPKEQEGGIQLTHSLQRDEFKVIVKNGLIFDLDLSPKGRALLWIDTKLFTFVCFNQAVLETGEPIYLMCENAKVCISSGYESLLEGGFIVEEDENLPTLPCVLLDKIQAMAVRSKARDKIVHVPTKCAYTTVNTHELKELGIYEWWYRLAIPPTEKRYEVTRQLIDLFVEQADTLIIPFPDKQEVAFNLQPISMEVQMRID